MSRDGFADADIVMEGECTARPHPPGQRHRGQESAPRRMPVRAEFLCGNHRRGKAKVDQQRRDITVLRAARKPECGVEPFRDGGCQQFGPDLFPADPLAQMGLYRTDRGIYLAEWKSGKWVAYADYTLAIPEGDLWFTAPKTNSVVQLSTHCLSYDFTGQDGRKNIGGWIETAAGLAGR